jgi:hypothetical protein
VEEPAIFLAFDLVVTGISSKVSIFSEEVKPMVANSKVSSPGSFYNPPLSSCSV